MELRCSPCGRIVKTVALNLGFICAQVLGILLMPSSGRGQEWEAEIQRATIDHHPWEFFSERNEKFPTGMGLTLRRSLGETPLFLELGGSFGAESAPGQTCSWTWDPEQGPDCVSEVVDVSGGLFRASFGWSGKIFPKPNLQFDLKPRLGVGLIRVHREGRETRQASPDWETVVLGGFAPGVSFRISQRRQLWIGCSFNMDWIYPPFAQVPCDDCVKKFEELMAMRSFGIGVRWGGR